MVPHDRAEAILAAATRVFARSGYHQARVRDIAHEAGVAEGTLYRYFPGKEDMLVSLFRAGMRRYLTNLEAELAGAEDAPTALARLAGCHLGHLEAHPDFARVTQIELREAHPGLREAVNAAIAPYLERIEGIVQQGQAQGHFAPDVDPRVARDVVFGSLDACVTTWVMARHPYALGALSPQVARLLVGGLACPRLLSPASGVGCPGESADPASLSPLEVES